VRTSSTKAETESTGVFAGCHDEIEYVSWLRAEVVEHRARRFAHAFGRREQRRRVEIALQRDASRGGRRASRGSLCQSRPIASHPLRIIAPSQGLPLRVKRMRGTPFTSLKICRL